MQNCIVQRHFEKPKDFKAWWTVGGYWAIMGRAMKLCLFIARPIKTDENSK